jgi:hypothetical protein
MTRSQQRAARQSLQIMTEAPWVIAHRMQQMISTHPGNALANAAEFQRMWAEKVVAAQQASVNMMFTAWSGNPWFSLAQALEPVRSTVAANRRRLQRQSRTR